MNWMANRICLNWKKASWLDVQVAAKVGENFGSIVGPDFQRNEKGDILIDRKPVCRNMTRATTYWVMPLGTGQVDCSPTLPTRIFRW